MLQKTKHRDIIYHIIEDIFSWEYMTYIALRGDTLSYFLYSLDHFPTDISIEIVRKIPNEPRFQVYIESLFARYGKITQISKLWDTFFFTLQYWDAGINIIIEIHTKIWMENQYEIANIYGLELLAQEKSTIFSNKLIDLTSKKIPSGRDMYDIYFYFTHDFPINQHLVKERTGKNLREYLLYLLEFLDKKVSPETLLVGLEELLDTKQMLFVQEKLLNELVIRVQWKISDIQ